MAELKTQLTKANVSTYIETIEEAQKKADSKILLKLLGKVTGKKAEMWGTSIIGFGRYTYTGSDGKTKEWMAIGFSPRKQNITIYTHAPAPSLLAKLGKHKTKGGCLYINKLESVDLHVLEKILREGYEAKAGTHSDYRAIQRQRSKQ